MKTSMVILIAIFMSGCAGQGMKLEVETENSPCGNKKVSFSTDYQVEDLQMGRTIEGGGESDTGTQEGCGGGYVISLGKATTKDADSALILELIRMLMEEIK
jgi:hypothetical protein